MKDCLVPLTDTQRQRLRDLSDVHKNNKYTSVNSRLDAYLTELKDRHPESFYGTSEDPALRRRVFIDQPMTLTPGRYDRHVRSVVESPWRIVPVSA